MRVNKRKYARPDSCDSCGPSGYYIFFKRHGFNINISAAFRDEILPHKFCFVDVEDDRLIFTPTDDEDGYQLRFCGGSGVQGRLTWCAADRFSHIPEKQRIYGTKAEDGTIIFQIKENNNGEQ